MDIRDQIRKGVGSKLKERNQLSYNQTTQPNIHKLSNFLIKSGYRLVDVVEQEDGKTEVLLEPIKAGYMYPEISYDLEYESFYALVKNYGMLDASDLEEIIKGYQNALGVIKYLDELDLNSLEIIRKED